MRPSQTEAAIIAALESIGDPGATMPELEKATGIERHTLAKYLRLLHSTAFVAKKKVGNALLWYLDHQPLIDVLSRLRHHATYAEHSLLQLLDVAPEPILLIDTKYTIRYSNKTAHQTYGDILDRSYYQVIHNLPNPVSLQPLTRITMGVTDRADFTTRDCSNVIVRIKAERIKHENLIMLLIEPTNAGN